MGRAAGGHRQILFLMKICIDFFRTTGKWYNGGEVEIKDGTYLWSPDFKQQIVENQAVLKDGWQDHFHVVTRDLDENSRNPEYHQFFYHFFPVGSFVGIEKGITNELL